MFVEDCVSVRVSRPPGCLCNGAWVDSRGNVVSVRTCPVCTRKALDALRGIEYAVAYLKCDDTVKAVLLKQKEFFSA